MILECKKVYLLRLKQIKFAQSSSQWKARPIPEEMSLSLLASKKQENLDSVHAANIFRPTQTRINREK
jgi:hypothetical protein